MTQDSNFGLSEISLPEPSVINAPAEAATSQFTNLLSMAKTKHQESEQRWEALVDMLIIELSK